MKLANYARYTKMWTPRQTIILAVGQGIASGVFLGSTLSRVIETGGHNMMALAWPLAFAVVAGVGALRATAVALHNCPRPQNDGRAKLSVI
jgi:hypothetical protein